MKAHVTTRIRIVAGALCLVAVLLVAKLYLVQIRDGELFSDKARRQYSNASAALFDRGAIYFENKDGTRTAAATLKDGYTLAMSPKDLVDPEGAYTALSGLIELDKEVFMQKAAKTGDPYEELAKRVEDEEGTKISELGIPGINLYRDRWRFYPGKSMAAHVLGFIGYNADNELAGRYGLERTYESVLARSSKNVYVNFFAEIFANLNETFIKGEPKGDIITSIEPTVESYAEKIVKKIGETWQSDVTGMIVIDPMTGEVKAMAAYPAFDPNNFKDEDPGTFANPLVESVFEMGSIIKPLTLSAGIDDGAITARTTYNDTGSLVLDGKKISNFDGKGRGPGTTMQQVLNESLNTGAAYAVSKMGNTIFSEYMYNFGLGELTGIDLPNEAKGIVSNLKSPRDIEHATASYGQGIAMTPINTVRALSALANGGLLMRPHVAKEIAYTLGYSKTIEPEEQRRVIKKETAEEITRMLIEAVDTSLVGGRLKMAHYSIAAKTGTAQIADTQGGYYDDRILHSFFGYFPAYNPRFLVFLFTKNPKGARYSSETLANPFIDITKFLINYYEIPPDR